MMAGIDVTLAWCVVQVTAMSLVGLLFTLLARRKHALASTAAVLSILMILVMTALSPFPIPRFSFLTGDRDVVQGDRIESRHHGELAAAAESAEVDRLEVELPSIRSALLALGEAIPISPQRSYLPGWVSFILIALTAIGMLQLLLATRSLRNLLKGSVLVDDVETKQLVARIAGDLNIHVPITVIQSDRVSSAAVFGWRSPRILLPQDWRRWNHDERQAVLAHELAHISRHDFVWRLLGTITAAIHFFNPAVHLLLRRLVFSQELAADAVASRWMGHNAYLRALANLTLRHSDSNQSRVGPSFMPVFSGHLIGRIKMLHATDGLDSFSSSRLVRGSVCGAIVLFGFAVVAARGFGQPPSESQPAVSDQPEARIAARRSTESSPPTNPLGGLFDRQQVAASLIPENEIGMVAVHVGELSEHSQGRLLLGMFGGWISQQWQTMFPCPQPPVIDFRSIDSIVADAKFSGSYVDDDDPDTKDGNSTFGCHFVVIRFDQPVAWQQWIETYIPDAEKLEHEGVVYFQLSIPDWGPALLHVAERDPQTLVMVLSMDREPGQIVTAVGYEETENRSAWASSWQHLDGGLVSIIFHLDDTTCELPEETDDESLKIAIVRQLQQIAENSDFAGYSLDATDDGSRLGIRCRLSCADRQSAQIVVDSFSAVSQLATTMLQESRQNPSSSEKGEPEDSTDQMLNEIAASLLAATKVDLAAGDDGAVDVVFHASCQVPSLVQFVTAVCREEF